ncbi:phage baseplate protein [Dysgonomonas termitidis]|uniref:Baseplate structural protein Gp10 C-terminal domain-containing protein n=1 Tax=Dysgonomonas termitidis TaxID=1516126 RepID=A0ABV9KY56_9BACT
MNSVNFLGQSNFPLSSDTLDFMQEMIFLASKLAQLGGSDKYILSGCADDGLNVAPGYVAINGELLPFAGGAKQTTVYINEVRRDVDASGYHFPQVYKTRTVAFGLGNPQYNWADFNRVQTNTQLAQAIADLATTVDGLRGIPAGVIVMWSGNPGNVPPGWALCDGLLGRPNLMGKFIVGFSQTDDDYNAIGKTGGSKQVALTVDHIPSHSHGMRWNLKKSDNANDRDFQYFESTGANEFASTSAGGGQPHENRPPYYVLAYIIKL